MGSHDLAYPEPVCPDSGIAGYQQTGKRQHTPKGVAKILRRKGRCPPKEDAPLNPQETMDLLGSVPAETEGHPHQEPQTPQEVATVPTFSVTKGAGYRLTISYSGEETFIAGVEDPRKYGVFISLSAKDLKALATWIHSVTERTKNV
jgi:hypothetical protein